MKKFSVIRSGNNGAGSRTGIVALLGGRKMPDEANEVVEPLGGPTIDDAKRKLLEALAILDQLQAPAEIGARLQDVIDRLDSPPIE